MKRRWAVTAPGYDFVPVLTRTRRGAQRFIDRKARAYMTVPEIVYNFYRIERVQP